MKKWIIIILCVIAGLFIIGVLHEAGYLNFKWQTLTMVFAALAGPYTYLKNKLFNKNNPDSVQEIINRAKQGLLNDEEHRADFDTQISNKEAEINKLENQITSIDKKLREMERQQETSKAEIREMTSDEIAREFEKLYGNEKDD